MFRQLDKDADIRAEWVAKDSPFGAEQDIYALSNIFKGVVDEEYFGGTLVCDSFSDKILKESQRMYTGISR